jgi:Outer membrane protein beta-barrel domain
MNQVVAGLGVLVLAGAFAPPPASAQDARRLFAGGAVGVSTLQADGRSITTAADAALSLYKPENGPALDVFAGLHLTDYFSVQANGLWNSNDITLVSSLASPQGSAFYEQQRRSRQAAFVADALIYFRGRESAVRPYLGTGLAVFRFTSDRVESTASHGLEPPASTIESTQLGLRSHVGIDFAVSGHLRFRYTFSETISRNPISPSLTPPGQRRLANFQNLFGLVREF